MKYANFYGHILVSNKHSVGFFFVRSYIVCNLEWFYSVGQYIVHIILDSNVFSSISILFDNYFKCSPNHTMR